MNQPATNNPENSGPVPLVVFLVISVAVTGYFVGLQAPMNSSSATQQTNSTAKLDGHERASEVMDSEGSQAVPSTSYADMAQATRQRAAAWQSRLSDLKSNVDPLGPVVIPPGAKQLALAERAARRAFNGAPPTVPHPIDQHSSQSCIACHGQGVRTDSLRIPQMPHPFYASCTQCHVESRSTFVADTSADKQDIKEDAGKIGERAVQQPVQNNFVGSAAPTGGPRAFPGAPPQIPHSTWMRSDCNSCHGLAGQQGMRTTHPWRRSCEQCHAPSAELDQAPLDPKPQFLPSPMPLATRGTRHRSTQNARR